MKTLIHSLLRKFALMSGNVYAYLFNIPDHAYTPKNDIDQPTKIQKLAIQGDADAQYKLGDIYTTGIGVITKDVAQAVYWYRKAAEQGNAGAQFNLGERYREGTGVVPRDDTQAVYWYRKAAEQGHARAQYNLGVMYDYPHRNNRTHADLARKTGWFPVTCNWKISQQHHYQ